MIHGAILTPETRDIEQSYFMTRRGERFAQRREGRADAAVAHRTDEIETGDADPEWAVRPGSAIERQGRERGEGKPGIAGHGGIALAQDFLKMTAAW